MDREVETLHENLTAPDGIRLHSMRWLPDGQPKAVIVLVHGIGEHIGRYRELGEALALRGFAAFGLDHRGHGESAGPRAAFNSLNQLVSDMDAFAARAAGTSPQTPVYLLGHSMGALIALLLAGQTPSRFAGVIASGVPLALVNLHPGLLGALALLDRSAPRLPLLKLDTRNLARDPAAVARNEGDPLNFKKRLSIRVIAEIVRAAQQCDRALKDMSLPLLVLHAGDDRVTHVSGAKLLYEKVASTDKTLKIYPHLYHELFHDYDRYIVFNDIAAWLDQRR